MQRNLFWTKHLLIVSKQLFCVFVFGNLSLTLKNIEISYNTKSSVGLIFFTEKKVGVKINISERCYVISPNLIIVIYWKKEEEKEN